VRLDFISSLEVVFIGFSFHENKFVSKNFVSKSRPNHDLLFVKFYDVDANRVGHLGLNHGHSERLTSQANKENK